MDSAKTQLADKLKSSNNILVTVSRDPSVDQLSALIGLTLLLNKLGKHAAAIFSGNVPSTLEFLQPDETIEKNTDSLQDFIIALDKSKADKLRYKVEDDVVRIFITPYKTSISQDDLEFSQGDFNVDVVIGLGVQKQEDLDEAVTAHGRILHDATVTSINTSTEGGLGSIVWNDDQASSLSELVTDLVQQLGADLLDSQIATALLTGIVAETERFSNDKTSSQTMAASSKLMAAGANQQLVASKLEEPVTEVSGSTDSENQDDGSLDIEHGQQEPAIELPEPKIEESEVEAEVSEPGLPSEPEVPSEASSTSKIITEPPALGGTLTANTQPEGLDPITDPLSLPQQEEPQLLDREQPAQPDQPALTPPPADWTPPAAPEPPSEPALQPSTETLSELEASVNSPHQQANQPQPEQDQSQPADDVVGDARDEVSKALVENPTGPQPPIQALNAQPLDENLNTPAPVDEQPAPQESVPAVDQTPVQPQVTDPNAPPPVPPPIPFQFGNQPNSDQNQQ